MLWLFEIRRRLDSLQKQVDAACRRDRELLQTNLFTVDVIERMRDRIARLEGRAILLSERVRALEFRATRGPAEFGSIGLVSQKESSMGVIQSWEVPLPKLPEVPPDGVQDVASRHFKASTPDVVFAEMEVPLDVASVIVDLPPETTVEFSIFYLDAAGNKTAPKTKIFTTAPADTTPPEDPGEFGEIMLVGHRIEPDLPAVGDPPPAAEAALDATAETSGSIEA